MKKTEINLNDVIHKKDTALVGRENGERSLSELQQRGVDFETQEKSFDVIEIVVPERVVTINKSFFLGLFETVVQRLGRDGFFKKYTFQTTEHIKNKIKSHVEAALLESGQGDILNA